MGSVSSARARAGQHAGMQLEHAGRKASNYRPWSGDGTVPKVKADYQRPRAKPVKSRRYQQPRDMTASDLPNHDLRGRRQARPAAGFGA